MTVEIVITSVTVHGTARGFAAVVVPVDPDSSDHRALAVAGRLSLASGAPVHLVAVADPIALVRDEWRTTLHELAARVGVPPVAASIVRATNVADGVRTVLAELPGSIVCMETEAPGRFVDAFELTSGSAVVHHVGVPVVLVGPHAPVTDAAVAEIVAFVDGSAAATKVVELAAQWAEGFGVRLWIVEVVEPCAGLGVDDFSDSAHVARLAHGLGQRTVPIDWEVLHGRDVAAEITRFLGEHPHALAVVGSHGRSGWAELKLGSISMRTVHDSPVPVVIVPTH